jgi:hypothetical protein
LILVATAIGVIRERLLGSAAEASVATAGIAFLAYLSALAPDLTWANHSGDGGELITASFTLGVAHPPGYPTYVVLGKLFSTLPAGTIAFRYNLFSAASLAIAAGLLAATVIRSSQTTAASRRLPSHLVGVVAGLTVAFAPLVWSQAIIAEVYALNLVFLAAFLLALTYGSGRAHFVAGLLLGLSWTTHPTSLLMLAFGLTVVPRNSWPRLAAGILLGLTPLLLLPLLGSSGSPLIWGRPEVLAGWWRLITADIYRPNVFGLVPADWWSRLRQWAPIFAANILLLAIPVALLRAKHGERSARIIHNSRFTARNSQLVLLLTALLYTIFAFTYATQDAEVLLLPAVMALGLLLGLRMGRLGLVALLLPAALLLFNLQSQSLDYESSVRTPAEQLLREAPPGALLLTAGDQSYAALSYFLRVERQRPDLSLVDANLFQFDWYRQRLNQEIPSLGYQQHDDLRAFIGRNLKLRSVCAVSLLSADGNYCLYERS